MSPFSFSHDPRPAILTGLEKKRTPAFAGDFSRLNDLRSRDSNTFTV